MLAGVVKPCKACGLSPPQLAIARRLALVLTTGRRLPPLGTAFAWEAIFGVPASELFAGLRENIGEDIKKRLLELRSKLEKGGMKGNELYLAAQKLRWLGGRLDDKDRPKNS